MSGVEVTNLTRPPITVTATLREAVYATVTESVTQTSSNYLIVNCISTNLGGGYTPGLVSAPDYFNIAFWVSPPGPGSLEIYLGGLNRAVTATISYQADQPMTHMNGNEFTIPAVSTSYSQIVSVPLPQGGTYVEFTLTPQPEGAGVACLTLTWIPG